MKATTEFTDITVFGARGHTLMILRALEAEWRGRVRVRALIDDIGNGFTHPGLGVPVISSADRLHGYATLPVLLTVADPRLRAATARRLAAEGAVLATAVFPGLPHVDPAVRYGAGAVCMPWTRIGPDVSLGEGALVLASALGHDVEIGAFATLAGESLVAGHVRIGPGVNIAPRAVIANGTRRRWRVIGAGAGIGTGAVVICDVAPGARMAGNPALPLRDWVRLQRLLRAEGPGRDG